MNFTGRLFTVVSLLLGMVVSMEGQPTTVTVTDTLYGADGSLLRGTVNIRLNATCAAPPTPNLIPAGYANQITVGSDGIFTAVLVPNDTCTPKSSYYVTYDLVNSSGSPQRRYTETWYVAASPTTTTISAVRTAIIPSSITTISFTQLTGGTLGDMLYGTVDGTFARLPGNTAGSKRYLTQTGTGTAAAAPAWTALITGSVAVNDCLKASDAYTIVSAGAPCGSGGGGGATALTDLTDVTAIRGNSTVVQMATAASTAENDCAKFDADGNLVSAGTGCTTSSPNHNTAFTAQTSVTVTHNLGTLNVVPTCYDGSDREIEPHTVTVTSINAVTVTFLAAQTGRCVVNGSGTGVGGGGGAAELLDLSDVSAKQGNSTTVQMFSGSSPTSGHCAKFDANGNLTSNGANCGATALTGLSDVTAKRGTGTIVVMSTGAAPATNDCAKFDSNGNLVSAGAACGSGGGGGSYTAGTGIDSVQLAAGVAQVNTTTVAPMPLNFTTSQDFGSISNGACATPVTVSSLSGVMAGDALAVGTNPPLNTGLFAVVKASTTSGEASLTVCNLSGSSVDPANTTFRIVKNVVAW